MLMFGNEWKIPVPDLDRTDLFVIFGGNPAASKGSIFSHRDVMGAMRELRARGGRVIVIDPVRTQTARSADQWIGLRPGSDAAFMLGVAYRSEEHTSELQSLMRISYAVSCLKKKTHQHKSVCLTYYYTINYRS